MLVVLNSLCSNPCCPKNEMKNAKLTPTGRSCAMPMERPKRLFLVRKFTPGDRVYYYGDETDRGTVTETNGRRVRVLWDNATGGRPRELWHDANDVHPIRTE